MTVRHRVREHSCAIEKKLIVFSDEVGVSAYDFNFELHFACRGRYAYAGLRSRRLIGAVMKICRRWLFKALSAFGCGIGRERCELQSCAWTDVASSVHFGVRRHFLTEPRGDDALLA